MHLHVAIMSAWGRCVECNLSHRVFGQAADKRHHDHYHNITTNVFGQALQSDAALYTSWAVDSIDLGVA